jgi:hypothetical protein
VPSREPEVPVVSRFGRWLLTKTSTEPLWLLQRGLLLTLGIVVMTAVGLSILPQLGVFGLPLCLITWGTVVLLDVALRGSSIHDARLAALFLLIGFGNLVVAVLAAVS